MSKGSFNDSEENTELSDTVKAKLIDINKLIGRLTFYRELVNTSSKHPTSIEKNLGYFEAQLSIIETLAAEQFQVNASPDAIDRLVDALYKYKEEVFKVVGNPAERDKIDFNCARTEAVLKGFKLGLHKIPEMGYDIGADGLECTEKNAAIEATKKAILDVAGKHYEPEKYINIIKERAEEILREKSSSLIVDGKSGYRQKKIDSLNTYIASGSKKIDFLDESLAVKKAVDKSINAFINSLEKDTANLAAISPPKLAAESLIKDVIKKMAAENKYIFSAAKIDAITKALQPKLEALGPDYLVKNKNELINELAGALKSQKKFSTRLTGNYTISNEKLGNITEKFDKKHQPLAISDSNKKVTEVFDRGMSHREIAVRLNNFSKQTGMDTMWDSKKIPSTADLVKLRQAYPKKFDESFSEKFVVSKIVKSESVGYAVKIKNSLPESIAVPKLEAGSIPQYEPKPPATPKLARPPAPKRPPPPVPVPKPKTSTEQPQAKFEPKPPAKPKADPTLKASGKPLTMKERRQALAEQFAKGAAAERTK